MTLAVIVGSLTGAAIYYPFVNSRWGTAIGILGVCAGYTLVVFGLVWSVNECSFVAEKPKPTKTILIIHLICVAWIAEIINFGLFIKPSLPIWLDSPLGINEPGRPSGTGFDLLEMAVLGMILLVEFLWLLRNMPSRQRCQGE